MMMFIEQIFPAVVAAKSTLHERLFTEVKDRGLPNDDMKKIISIVPKALINAFALLDKLTNLWRYEFGVSYDIGNDFI